MSWITERDIDWDTLAKEEAKAAGVEPPARSAGGGGGRLPPIMSCMTINPRALKGVREMNSATTFGSSVLTRVQEEAIATTVSVANECRY
jgi:alkylhydroperoxidase family enzyme